MHTYNVHYQAYHEIIKADFFRVNSFGVGFYVKTPFWGEEIVAWFPNPIVVMMEK